MSTKKGSLIKNGLQFVSESKKEMRKVTWPARKEAIAITGAVIFAVFLMGIYLAVVDWILSEIVQYLIIR